MKIRHILVAMTVAGALLVAGAAPALAWGGPPVPPGCTFDQATGVLTCTTTTTSTITAGPFNCTVATCEPPATFGGFTTDQICQFNGTPASAATVFIDVTLIETVTTTTTTEQHGLNGKIFNTSTSSGPPTLVSVGGDPECGSIG
jgi:hypothetical protein